MMKMPLSHWSSQVFMGGAPCPCERSQASKLCCVVQRQQPLTMLSLVQILMQIGMVQIRMVHMRFLMMRSWCRCSRS